MALNSCAVIGWHRLSFQTSVNKANLRKAKQTLSFLLLFLVIGWKEDHYLGIDQHEDPCSALNEIVTPDWTFGFSLHLPTGVLKKFVKLKGVEKFPRHFFFNTKLSNWSYAMLKGKTFSRIFQHFLQKNKTCVARM